MAGCPFRPKPKVSSAYGGVGRVTASAFFSVSTCLVTSTFSRAFFFRSSENANWSYSSQVTSHLPIQNGAICTGCCGPSLSARFSSPAGLPMVNVPPGIGSSSNFTSVPGIASV